MRLNLKYDTLVTGKVFHALGWTLRYIKCFVGYLLVMGVGESPELGVGQRNTHQSEDRVGILNRSCDRASFPQKT